MNPLFGNQMTKMWRRDGQRQPRIVSTPYGTGGHLRDLHSPILDEDCLFRAVAYMDLHFRDPSVSAFQSEGCPCQTVKLLVDFIRNEGPKLHLNS